MTLATLNSRGSVSSATVSTYFHVQAMLLSNSLLERIGDGQAGALSLSLNTFATFEIQPKQITFSILNSMNSSVDEKRGSFKGFV